MDDGDSRRTRERWSAANLGGRSISCVGQREESKLSSGSTSSCHGRDDYSKEVEVEMVRACSSTTMAAAMVRPEGKRKEKKRCWSLVKKRNRKMLKKDDDDVAERDAEGR